MHKRREIDAEVTILEVGAERVWEFRILDVQGRPVQGFDERHQARLHLVVVRRDLRHFQHLHPSLGGGSA